MKHAVKNLADWERVCPAISAAAGSHRRHYRRTLIDSAKTDEQPGSIHEQTH